MPFEGFPADEVFARRRLFADLSQLGYQVDTYDGVVPLLGDTDVVGALLRWLPHGPVGFQITLLTFLDATRSKAGMDEEISRTLTELFELDGLDERVRWQIGASLADKAHKNDFDRLARLMAEPAYGSSRACLPYALEHADPVRAVPVLIAQLHDDEVNGPAIKALRTIGDPEAAKALEPFLNDSRAWVRAEVKKALAKFDKKNLRAKS